MLSKRCAMFCYREEVPLHFIAFQTAIDLAGGVDAAENVYILSRLMLRMGRGATS